MTRAVNPDNTFNLNSPNTQLLCKSQLVIVRHIFSKYSPWKIYLKDNCDWHVVSTDGCYFSETVLASAVGKSLMNTIRQYFIMNFIQQWSVEKIPLLKIFQKKGGVLYFFFHFFSPLFLFLNVILLLRINMLKNLCTHAQCNRINK